MPEPAKRLEIVADQEVIAAVPPVPTVPTEISSASLETATPWTADPAERDNCFNTPLHGDGCELPPLPDDDEHASWLRCEPRADLPLPPTAAAAADESIQPQATPGAAGSSSSDVATAVVTLTLRPHLERGGYHTDRFDCCLDDALIVTSRQPRHDAARELLARGFPPESLLRIEHAGAWPDPTIVPQPIGDLAEWTFEESDAGGIKRRRWRPFGMPRNGVAVASKTGGDTPTGTRGPSDGLGAR
jgi:hypothetical protein